MHISIKVILSFGLLFLFSCSASYEKLSNDSFNPPSTLSKHLMEAYKTKADFEAKEMHDWNSTKLYAEKALRAADGKDVLPEKINYWVIPADKQHDLIKGYNNLMTVYHEAVLLDPFNLAKAISSLDCWAEQQEENWQTWDIEKCRNDYLNAMHNIYNTISKKEIKVANERNLYCDKISSLERELEAKNKEIESQKILEKRLALFESRVKDNESETSRQKTHEERIKLLQKQLETKTLDLFIKNTALEKRSVELQEQLAEKSLGDRLSSLEQQLVNKKVGGQVINTKKPIVKVSKNGAIEWNWPV